MSTRRRATRSTAVVATLFVVLAAMLLTTPSAAQDAPPTTGTGEPKVGSTGPSPGPWSFTPTSPQDGPGRNWFILEMQPGQVLRDSVAISNTTTEPLSFAIYPADAYNTENGGAFAIRPATEPRKGLAKWVTLGTDAYTVQPGRKVVIPFEIAVPADAGSGDHVGAIAAMDVNPEGSTESGGVKLDIKRVVGIRMYVRVAGPVSPKLEIQKLKVTTDAPTFGIGGDPSGTASYRVTNTGNATLAPVIRTKVSGGLGGPDTTLRPHRVRELLPGSSVVIRDRWDGLPVIGPLTVTATAVAKADDVSASEQQTTWIVPWPLLILLAALLAVAVGLLARRRKRRRGAAPPPPAASPGKAREPEPVHS